MSRRRIDLVSPPFAGHLHPMLAIGRALAVDHDIRVLSTAGAMSRVAAAGLQGRAILPGGDDALRAIVDPPHAIGSNPVRLHRQFQGALRLLTRLHDELHELYRHEPPELQLVDFTLPVAGSVAVQAGIPWWTTLPAPCVLESRDGPPSYLGGLRPGTSFWRRLQHTVGRRLIRGFKRSVFWLYRARIRGAGVAQLYRDDGEEAIYSPTCILAMASPELEFARRWPPALRFVGPMLYTPPHPLTLSEPPFVDGRKHVLVTLGTHLGWRKDAFAASVRAVAAVRQGIEFHFTDGDTRRTGSERVANFARLPFVDYDRFVGRYDAIVHHGGAGVLHHTLAHGKPAVVFPCDYDQFDHAARLEAAGVAVWLRRPDGLGSAIDRVLVDDAMQANCRRFAARIDVAAGLEQVRELVRRHFA
ncbi:MAG: glycosyl transferase [Planctomycetes bacterium]|nr:glycosyl transferase [Planctomycetota bacterium]